MEFGKEKIQWLEFDLLKHYPHVQHAVVLRHGGVSQKNHATLNLGSATSDVPNAVKLNREEVRKTFQLKHLVFPQQTHGVEVARITAENALHPPQADALFTTEKNIGLAVTHADCQAAVFYDPKHEAVAVAHCGWRGNVQNYYAIVVEKLQQQIGTRPQDLIVCLSPSLGPDHSEFKNYKEEFPPELWDFQVKPFYFDLWAIAKKQLVGAGVPEKQIEITSICTYCAEKDYFSHRRDKETGRNATFVALKN